MLTLLFQIAGLVFLLAGIGLGYWLWIRPRYAALDWQSRGLLLLIILTLVGGFVGSPFWWANDPRSFSWKLPPLASRMLAAAGWTFVVACFLTLQHPTYRRVRLILLLLFVYLAPLAVAIVLFHLDRFDPTAPVTYAFFAIVIIMVVSTLWYLWRQPRVLAGEEPRDALPAQRLVSGWLAAVAVVAGLWGLALFVTDNGPSNLIWAWPGDPLSSRLIGVMLLAMAVGAAFSRRSADVARLMLSAILTYGLGLAVASLWNGLAGKPVPLSYLVVFGLMALVSAALLVSRRSAVLN